MVKVCSPKAASPISGHRAEHVAQLGARGVPEGARLEGPTVVVPGGQGEGVLAGQATRRRRTAGSSRGRSWPPARPGSGSWSGGRPGSGRRRTPAGRCACRPRGRGGSGRRARRASAAATSPGGASPSEGACATARTRSSAAGVLGHGRRRGDATGGQRVAGGGGRFAGQAEQLTRGRRRLARRLAGEDRLEPPEDALLDLGHQGGHAAAIPGRAAHQHAGAAGDLELGDIQLPALADGPVHEERGVEVLGQPGVVVRELPDSQAFRRDGDRLVRDHLLPELDQRRDGLLAELRTAHPRNGSTTTR